MKFSSLPQSCRAVLTLLIGSGPLSRTEVVRALEISDGYPTSTSDTGIRRLVIDGLAKRRSDNSYEPTTQGKKIMQEHEQAELKAAAELLARNSNPAAPAPAETTATHTVSIAWPKPEESPTLVEQAMLETELNAALDAAIAQLQSPVIPAHSARVYRRLLFALDVLIQDALEPITRLVDGRP